VSGGAFVSSVGREGPGLSPLFVTQRGRRLHHRACERLLEMTRPIAGGVGRARAGHVRPKKKAGPRLSWCAIEQHATRGELTEESLYSENSSGGGPVDLACRAVKVAWLLEAKRADLRGEEVSLVRLNDAYRRGRQWYARHADNPEVCLPHCTLTSGCH